MWVENSESNYPIYHLEDSDNVNSTDKVNVTVAIDMELKKAVRVLAISNGETMTEIVEKSFMDYVKLNNKKRLLPNTKRRIR